MEARLRLLEEVLIFFFCSCDTQFAKKRSWSLFFPCFFFSFFLSGGTLLGLGIFGEAFTSKIVEFWLDSCARGVGG